MTKETSPAFQFYPKDWRTSLTVSSMTHEQKGIFMDLLCVSWMEDGLPDDFDMLAAVVGSTPELIRTVVEQAFFKKGNEWRNKKQETLRKERREYIKKKQKAGKASGKARSKGDISLNTCSTQGEHTLNPSSLSLSSSSTPSPTKENTYIPIFNHWNSKGIKKHRFISEAMKSAINAKLSHYTEAEITKAIDNYKTVIDNPDQFFTHCWTLLDFLKREGGFVNFVDENEPWKGWPVDKPKAQPEEEDYDEWAIFDKE